MKRRKFMAVAIGGSAGPRCAGNRSGPEDLQLEDDQRLRARARRSTWTGPGSATDLAKRIEAMSNGRLKIQVYGAGELIPALEGFDAVRAGTVEMNHANSYFWTGKTLRRAVLHRRALRPQLPGHQRLALRRRRHRRCGTRCTRPSAWSPFPCGNTGVQMTGWFKKEIKSVDDFKGLKMRIPGLAGKVYASLGVDVKLLPGGEIFPALERGVIDAAEFVGPYQDRRLGLHKAAKYYYTTGWHETATVSRAARSTRRRGRSCPRTCRRSSRTRAPRAT